MLTLERADERTFTLISDDKNGENMAIQDAIEESAPHLLGDFEETQMDDDDKLRFSFPSDEWASLLEVLDTLADSGDPSVVSAYEEVDAAKKELPQ